ncbi:MAG: nucleotidyltransferase domain-containing protein [Caldilineaceae bacterium]
MSSIPNEQMEAYKRTAYRRWQAEQTQREQRRAKAWQLANVAAQLLKEQFAVQRVVVFGSLLQADRFHLRSDVDLAAWGLTAANWLKAMAAVHALSDEIEFNLVDVGVCSSELLTVIEQEGMPL